MNILFAGPWDLAGKYTAERFLQEGHSVCWLTRERARSLWDGRLRGVPAGQELLSALRLAV